MGPVAARRLCLLLAAVGVAGLALAVAGRVGQPFPLEWMEGATLLHALRLVAGQPIYGEPSATFVPYLYPPLAYLPMAAGAVLFGPSLVVARAGVVLLLAGCTWGLWRAARGQGDSSAGLLAVAMWCVGYGYAGAFMDLVRVDMLFVTMVVWGTERLLAARPVSGLLLLAASVLAKQHGALFLLAASLHMWRDPASRRAVALTWLALVSCLAGLHWGTGGHFTTYVFDVPAAHGAIARLLPAYLLVDVGLHLPVLFGAVLWHAHRRRKLGLLHALILAALVAGTLGRAHAGGHDNIRMPGLALLSLGASAPLAAALRSTALSARRRNLLVAAVVLQFAVLFQPPVAHWPRPLHSQAMAELGDALDRCAVGGSHAALDLPGLGNTTLVHTMALSDLRSMPSDVLGELASRRLVDHLASPFAPGALSVGASFPGLSKVLHDHYTPCAQVRVPMTTGYQPPAQRVYRLR